MKKLRGVLRAAAALVAGMIVVALFTWGVAGEGERARAILSSAPSAQVGEGSASQVEWGALPAEVVAWVEVPGTNINEPVAQASSEAPNAYLYRDALGQGAYGTPYIDCDCAVTSRLVVVYGHHMSDGSVFADFANFADEAYAREHGRIVVYRRGCDPLTLEVVAVDVVDASRERLVIDQSAAFDEVVTGADLVIGDVSGARQLFAFVTCSYQTSNSRTIVYGIPQNE